jgi:agmatinase
MSTSTSAIPSAWSRRWNKLAGRILDAGVSLLGLGGDHFVSYPLLRAQAARHGPLSLVHLDAHSDTWASDDHNHGPCSITRKGMMRPTQSKSIRAGSRRTPAILDARWLSIRAACGSRAYGPWWGQAAYLTLDIDFLDPAYAPGTGTPVIGGPTTHQARELLFALRGLNVVGGDQVEVAPPYDALGQITALAGATLAADILYLIGLARAERGAVT